MLYPIKHTYLIVTRSPHLRLLLMAAVIVLLPTSHQAQCPTVWDAAGAWQITQKGQPNPIKLSLVQKDRMITGTAEHTIIIPKGSGIAGKFGGIIPVSGKVSGVISGDDFTVNIYWDNRTVGVYSSKISSSGMLDGRAHEMSSPRVLHSWQSQTALRCPPKPIKRSGRRTSTTSEAPPMKTPGIVASQVIWPFLNAPTGFVVLTWDAGADRPDATLHFKVGEGTETLLAGKSKGSIQLPVERYRLYTYVLRGGDKKLAEAAFVAQ